LPYYLRAMRQEDIRQVNDIDREAFPTQWPPPDYRRELGNPMARLMVVCDEVQCEANTPAGGVSGLVARVWRRCRFGSRAAASSGESVLGFAGIWLLADEAHITKAAVPALRHRRAAPYRHL
jgi:ribosomal-protein-alanine N-acetyltransferase